MTRLVCAYTGEKNYGPRTPPLCSLSLDLVIGKLYTLESCLLSLACCACSLSLDLVTGKLYALESCLLDSTQALPCGFTLEACYPLPAVLGFARLDST